MLVSRIEIFIHHSLGILNTEATPRKIGTIPRTVEAQLR